MLSGTVLLSIGFNMLQAPLSQRAATLSGARVGSPVLLDVETEIRAEEVSIAWRQTPSGFKYIEEKVGTGELPSIGDVVQVHYTVTLLSSGTTLGTSRGGLPLALALGKHDVPIWDEALEGMRIGGHRRMLVPPSAIPDSQAARVPGENRVLRFDFELLGTLDKRTPQGFIAAALPPFSRRVEIGRQLYMFLFALSFVPYFLPTDMQPSFYHDGKPVEEIRANRESRANSNFLGGDIRQIEGLFP